MTFSGGLRGLRPPATFWQPFRLLRSVNYMPSQSRALLRCG